MNSEFDKELSFSAHRLGIPHVILDEEDFVCLINGGILTINDRMKICLQDIGFELMFKELNKALMKTGESSELNINAKIEKIKCDINTLCWEIEKIKSQVSCNHFFEPLNHYSKQCRKCEQIRNA